MREIHLFGRLVAGSRADIAAIEVDAAKVVSRDPHDGGFDFAILGYLNYSAEVPRGNRSGRGRVALV
ncbi:MAG TPA: hypothetical protein PJ982_19815, partial [Lacipirellulaceae bacterium]|nr:hypothetical protein [Lacipirellulaceae bacterium]